jgi:hypothetical protein
MIENKIVYTIGFFITPRRNKHINHYSGSNKNNKKSKIKIRNFDRNSKVNFL